MEGRPIFTQEMTVEEFEKHYWYKTELQSICRKHKIPSNGTKAELEHYIKEFLLGNHPINIREECSKIRKATYSTDDISLDTKLIQDGFKFNNRARKFLAEYFKMESFSFTKEMASALRNAERNKDYDMTVADLISVYENKKDFNEMKKSVEEKTYQWNNFVKDFNNDERSKNFNHKMKVASILWRKVRDNPGPKKYRTKLLEEHSDDLKDFIISNNDASIR
ncbi:SAP domain-containing protein [Tissierellaceae bacterium HCP3S3_D8]